MTSSPKPPDWSERQQALDPGRSFIVQAPAGSGKTELLVRRFLVLLARASRPEEVLAITFTRKAAGEMKQRVLAYLQQARDQQEPSSELSATLNTILDRNRELGWNLFDNHTRLTILTLDSLSRLLMSRLPLSSADGIQEAPSEYPDALYESAALEVLRHLEQPDSDWRTPVRELLMQQGANIGRVQKLIATMLSKRDQWHRHVIVEESESEYRKKLQENWRRYLGHVIENSVERLPDLDWQALLEAMIFQSRNLDGEVVAATLHTQDREDPRKWETRHWQQFYKLLITGNKWRQKLDKRNGFPTEDKHETPVHKENVLKAIAELQNHGVNATLVSLLGNLPETEFSDQQWQFVTAANRLLVLAAAELKLQFRLQGAVDFTEIALNGINALGDEKAPGDAALLFDHQVRHILVDEFQDTSWNQLILLEKLTANWQADDGRSLFLVGDPMQSIYRFRKAEVSIFLNVWRHGIGHLHLQPLPLQTNFRSDRGVVEWINQAVGSAFDNVSAELVASVPYHVSKAWRENTHAYAGVSLYGLVDGDVETEAARIVEIVNQTRRHQPDHNIAILGRSRSHLVPILKVLQFHGIPTCAVEIDTLDSRQEIQDLMNLCRVLIYPGDDLAWLCLLRSPVCGLTLATLTNLVDQSETVAELMVLNSPLPNLATEDRERIQRIADIIGHANRKRGRERFSTWVHDTWQRLGFPICLDATALQNCERFFALLDEFGTLPPALGNLQRRVTKLWALARTPPGAVEVMTIHKAKGLEWDTVIVPSLHRQSRGDDKELILWQEISDYGLDDILLQAPIPPSRDDESDQKYIFLRRIEKEQSSHEAVRLFYVACTRARTQLHLTACLKSGDDGPKSPPVNSFASLVWRQLEPHCESVDPPQLQSPAVSGIPLYRAVSAETTLTQPVEEILPAMPPVEYSWAGERARRLGTVIHEVLHRIALEGIQRWTTDHIEQHTFWFHSLLRNRGFNGKDLESALDQLITILNSAVSDQRFRWIVDEKHHNRRFEWPLTRFQDGQLETLVMDCSFVDSGDTRWIIDFKTGSHAGHDTDVFLDNEVERYRAQLTGYAETLANLESRPIRLGLYFPSLKGWREWSWIASETP